MSMFWLADIIQTSLYCCLANSFIFNNNELNSNIGKFKNYYMETGAGMALEEALPRLMEQIKAAGKGHLRAGI